MIPKRNRGGALGIRGRFWPIAVVSLSLLLLAGAFGQVVGTFTDSETSLGNSFQVWTSRLWSENTQVEFEAGIIPTYADTRSNPGDVRLARDSGIFAFQGGITTAFWRYGVPADSWSSVNGAPDTVGDGGALAYDGFQYVYAFRGNSTRTFWRHDTTTGTWLARANTPAGGGGVGAGGALVCVGTASVYAFRGNGTNAFWRYNTATNTWTTRRPPPNTVGEGGALVYDGSTYIYALRGNGSRTFWRYDINANTWQAMRNTPAGGLVRAGGALAHDGAGYIYALRGSNSTAFWRYDIASNLWTVMSSAPATVGPGGALAYDGSGYIYAFSGNGSNAFWRYDVPNNAWTVMAVAPGNVTNGGALAFVPASTYVTSATIASRVVDTGIPGDRWDALFWDETLPANTGITFEARASDTLFAADSTTLAWTFVGGTCPITSGLPSGQYMQWRATLTTLDITVTPLLHEVRLYHY